MDNPIAALFLEKFSTDPQSIKELSTSLTGTKSYIVEIEQQPYFASVFSSNHEFQVFVVLTEALLRQGIRVPKIICQNAENAVLIQEHCGDLTLLKLIQSKADTNGLLPPEVMNLLETILSDLINIQLKVAADVQRLHPQYCINYGAAKIIDDLNYFRDSFLVASGFAFQPAKLADDFAAFSEYLSSFPDNFFYYRDLNTRNILIWNDQPCFIDYQGGRQGFFGCLLGALQPSVLSLIEHPRARLHLADRRKLLDFYLKKLNEQMPVDQNQFFAGYHAFSILKLLQLLGTYGCLKAKGSIVTQSEIQTVTAELDHQLKINPFPIGETELKRVCLKLCNSL